MSKAPLQVKHLNINIYGLVQGIFFRAIDKEKVVEFDPLYFFENVLLIKYEL